MGIEADFFLFDLYDDALDWGFETMDVARMIQRYLRRRRATRGVSRLLVVDRERVRLPPDEVRRDCIRYFQVVESFDTWNMTVETRQT